MKCARSILTQQYCRSACQGILSGISALIVCFVDNVYSRSVTNTRWAGNNRKGSMDNLERTKRREIMATRESLAFDMYGTLVDPIRIWKQLEQYFPGEAQRIAEIWRQKQLEFTFRLTAMERYEDFEQVTRKALDYALAAAGSTLATWQKDALMAQYNDLERFADVEPGLQRLKEAGYTMVVFSNGSPAMLTAIMLAAHLNAYLSGFVSVDE